MTSQPGHVVHSGRHGIGASNLCSSEWVEQVVYCSCAALNDDLSPLLHALPDQVYVCRPLQRDPENDPELVVYK